MKGHRSGRAYLLISLGSVLLLTDTAWAEPSQVVWMAGGHPAHVLSVAYSPDGTLLASSDGDQSIKLWRVSDRSLIRTLLVDLGPVYSVAFSPESDRLASGSADGTIQMWRVSDGVPIHTLTGHTGGVSSLTFAPSGHVLASGSFDRTIKLWCVSDGELLQAYDEETGSGVTSVAFSPDDRLISYGRFDATVVTGHFSFLVDSLFEVSPHQ